MTAKSAFEDAAAAGEAVAAELELGACPAKALRPAAMEDRLRLRNLRLLSKRDVDALDHRRPTANAPPLRNSKSVLPFSRQFVGRVATALDAGRLSVKRAASLLDLSLSDLAWLLDSYGHEAYFEA